MTADYRDKFTTLVAIRTASEQDTPINHAARKVAHALRSLTDDGFVHMDIVTGALVVEIDGKAYAITMTEHRTERQRLEDEMNRIRYQEMLHYAQTMPLPPDSSVLAGG